MTRNAAPPTLRLLSIDNWSLGAWSSQHLWVVVGVFFIVAAICYYSYTHEKREDKGKKGNDLRSTIGFVFILIKWLWVVVFNYNKMSCATLLAPTHILVHKHKPNNIKPSYITSNQKDILTPQQIIEAENLVKKSQTTIKMFITLEQALKFQKPNVRLQTISKRDDTF